MFILESTLKRNLTTWWITQNEAGSLGDRVERSEHIYISVHKITTRCFCSLRLGYFFFNPILLQFTGLLPVNVHFFLQVKPYMDAILSWNLCSTASVRRDFPSQKIWSPLIPVDFPPSTSHMAHWHPCICASAVLILFEQQTLSWSSQPREATNSGLLDEISALFYIHHIHAHTYMYRIFTTKRPTRL